MTKREAKIELYRAGTSISKITKQLKVPKSTVYDAVHERRNPNGSRYENGSKINEENRPN